MKKTSMSDIAMDSEENGIATVSEENEITCN